MTGITRKIIWSLSISVTFLILTAAYLGLGKSIKTNNEIVNSNGIVINEVCHNFSALENPDGDNYVEFYNGTDDSIFMEGYYLLDNKNSSEPMYLEAITIDSKQTIHVHIDNNWNGMDFTLDESMKGADAFTLTLYDADGKAVDAVSVPQIEYNTSWGRTTDGGATWNTMSITPGRSNVEAEYIRSETLDSPVYSVNSGFYDEEFMLELGTKEKDSTIYYTLDGSIPNENSLKYEEPIRIYDNSDQDNLYASLKEVSTGYIIEGFALGATTDEKVPKCMVVRSVVYSNDGMEKSEVETKTYFVDSEGKYKDMPIISLIADPDDLFGYENGIYVNGKCFDNYLANGEELELAIWSEWEANYLQRGKLWEREAHLDYFNQNHDLVLEQEVGIRIRGGQTRAFSQKSFNIYARSIYERNGFKTSFFENNTGTMRVTLSSCGNDIDTKIRDTLVYNLCRDLEFATMQTIPAYVFINGEYWGLYYVTEKYDEYYIEEHYDVNKEDVIMVKAEETEVGENAEDEYEIIDDFADDNDFSDDAVYQEFLNYIDLESFLDYYAAQVYIARCGDWPSSNWTMWKSSKVKEDNPYYDGKWRYMIYDLNWADGDMSEWLVEHDTIAYLREQDDIFNALMENAQFRTLFADRLTKMATEVFENGRVQAEITRLASIVEEGVKQDYERFYSGGKNEDAFEWGINNIRVFFERRGNYIFQLIENHCR